MISQDHEIWEAEARRFFHTLFHELGTGERIELRSKLPGDGQPMHKEFFGNPDEAIRFVLARRLSHEVYVGVAPRRGNVGTKEGVSRLFALWGDLDVKGQHTPTSRVEQLEGLPYPPSMLVWSGGGYHPYWFLKEPVRGSEELDRSERVMKRIAEGLDGDAVHDRSRILRVPGTLNLKQHEPRPVKLVHHDPEQSYTLDQLEEMSESLPEAAGDVAHKNEPETARHIVGPIRIGSRNNTLASLGGSMRRRGMSEEAIFAALTVENQNRCEPPLPRAEVRAIARSIGRYEAEGSSYNALGSTTFPVQVLPPTLRRFVKEAAASIGCPPDFIGVPMLAALGAAIGNSRVLEVKGGYTEGATLYTAVVGDPGTSKSPALDAATAPASKKQEELGRQYREAVTEYNREKRRWEAEWRSDPEIEPPEEPNFPRTVVQDVTVEALIERLGDNPRGLLSSNDELSGWVRQQDQYKSGNKGTDRQFWLSTWSNHAVFVDRKGRKEPLMVHRPFVGIAGGIQPGILPELKNNREDGLLDRFLFAYPDPKPSRWSDGEISKGTRCSYEYVYDELYGLTMDTDKNGSPDPIRATFTTEAKKLFVEAYDSLCEEMEHPDFPAHLKGPWSKMRAYLVRLSLIIGMAFIVEPRHRLYGEVFYGFMKTDPMITSSHVGAAIELIKYFKAHTRKVYAKLPGSGEKSTKQIHADEGNEADKGDSVARFLAGFLKEQGGRWEGMTSELYDICSANSIPGLPGGTVPFGKQIREIAQDPKHGLAFHKGHRGKQPIIKLSLSSPVTVDGTHTESTDITGSENEETTTRYPESSAREGNHLAEITNAMDRLFEEHPEHKEELEPDAIAVELFWWDYLDYIPTDEEVELVLNSWTITWREKVM